MGRYVQATTLIKGDTILIFSSKRVNPTEARITKVFECAGIIRFDTNRGTIKSPINATVQVPSHP
jgi:hypothetical protein